MMIFWHCVRVGVSTLFSLETLKTLGVVAIFALSLVGIASIMVGNSEGLIWLHSRYPRTMIVVKWVFGISGVLFLSAVFLAMLGCPEGMNTGGCKP